MAAERSIRTIAAQNARRADDAKEKQALRRDRYIRTTAQGKRFQAWADRTDAEPKQVDAVRPNAGIEASYRKKLDRLIDEMQASVTYWLTAAYRSNEPMMAQDEAPARAISRTMDGLARKWQRRFDDYADTTARGFAEEAKDAADRAFAAKLKKIGFTVEFKMTAAATDAYQAVIAENVGLIKSIASEYLTDVQGAVMRSVQKGRDLGGLSQELQARYGITKRRAATISRDQNNKATAVITRVRQKELGITEAVWQHSAGGKHPRASHVAFSGKKYDVTRGAYIDGEYIFPGEMINCRCVSKSVVPGFD